MEVILREDVEKVGSRGAVVKVADGYARNFLLPKKLAVAATDANKKIVEQEREAYLRREAKEKSDSESLAQMMASVTLTSLTVMVLPLVLMIRRAPESKAPGAVDWYPSKMVLAEPFQGLGKKGLARRLSA